MKLCPNCSFELDNDSFKFCPECGYNLKSDTPNSNGVKSEGLVGSIIDRVLDEIPGEYGERIRDSETIADVVENAKMMLFGPKRERRKKRRRIEIHEDVIIIKKAKGKTPAQPDEEEKSIPDLTDLQEKLIKTLPTVSNPEEYEADIIEKYAEYDSQKRKELLKDCWTITKLAEKHNIKRSEVEKAILSDEFLEKDLIGVFKVNPNNIRSLKILYRKA